MKGGHNRKSVAQHLTAGTLRPVRHGSSLDAARAHAPSGPPTRPKNLKGEARKLWDVVVAERAGIVGPADAASLRVLCEAYAAYLAAAEHLAGLTPGSDDHGRLVRAMRTLAETYTSLAVQFGLTPVSREKLPVGDTDRGDGVARW